MADKPDGCISVVVVDDHPVVRRGLVSMIDDEPDLHVVGQAGAGAEAVRLCTDLRPNVTLMDLRMPDMSGTDAIIGLRKQVADARVIVLTTYDGDEDVFRAVQAGARGYLLKGTLPETIMEAIRSVHAGGTLIAPQIATRLLDRMQSVSLSEREVEVLQLVAKGMSNKEIGAGLYIAEYTVKNHLKRIYVKLGVTDRTEAAMVAAQRGIIDVS